MPRIVSCVVQDSFAAKQAPGYTVYLRFEGESSYRVDNAGKIYHTSALARLRSRELIGQERDVLEWYGWSTGYNSIAHKVYELSYDGTTANIKSGVFLLD